MGHAPRDNRSEQLIADAQHLVACAREHEERLGSLVASLEADEGVPVRSAESSVAAALPSRLDSDERTPNPTDLVAFARDLCIGAREQRRRIESLVTAMLGGSAVRDANHARVLVVDDSADNRDLATTILEAAGFQVITACNGLEGVIAAHSGHPAIVLMDVTMPVLDGIEAARLIKASAGTRHMNILAHTAKPEFYEGPVTRLFVAVLAKPTTPEALVLAVRRFAEPARTEN